MPSSAQALLLVADVSPARVHGMYAHIVTEAAQPDVRYEVGHVVSIVKLWLECYVSSLVHTLLPVAIRSLTRMHSIFAHIATVAQHNI